MAPQDKKAELESVQLWILSFVLWNPREQDDIWNEDFYFQNWELKPKHLTGL